MADRCRWCADEKKIDDSVDIDLSTDALIGVNMPSCDVSEQLTLAQYTPHSLALNLTNNARVFESFLSPKLFLN